MTATAIGDEAVEHVWSGPVRSNVEQAALSPPATLSREDCSRLADCRHGARGQLAVPDKRRDRMSSTDGPPSIQCAFRVCAPNAGREAIAQCGSPDGVRQRTPRGIRRQGTPILQGTTAACRGKGAPDHTGGQTQLDGPCTARDTAMSHQGRQREHAIANSSANTFMRSD